tara:strand:- start:11846 stop:12496 length:651 start_codon:yes stop_codon:yes gene_type:complete
MSTETKGKLLSDIEFVDGKVLRCVSSNYNGGLYYFHVGHCYTIDDLSFRDKEGDLVVPDGDDRYNTDHDGSVYDAGTYAMSYFEEVVEQPDTNVPEQGESVSDELREPTPMDIPYTKEMYDDGVIPTKGMIHNNEIITEVKFRQMTGTHPQVLVTFVSGDVFDLTCLSFPEEVEEVAKELYAKHMKLSTEERKFMWGQCEEEYQQAWITIAEADNE